MFYGGYDHQMGEGQAVDLRRQVEHNRLESRLTKAHLANGPLSGELNPKSIATRGASALVKVTAD